MGANILIIDDDLGFATSLKSLLKKNGVRSTLAASPADGFKIYSQEKMDFDLLLIDYEFKGFEITGADIAQKIKRQNPYQAFAFMSGHQNTEFYRNMLQVGSSEEFILKGGEPEEIMEIVRRILAELAVSGNSVVEDTFEDELKREAEIRAFGMVGRSKALHSLVKLTENYRQFKSRFLIIGPTGAGKEMFAKAFQIPGKPFYAVDCTRFTTGQEHFVEAELYGCKKGAYTGADQDKRGVFEVANGGVIFLDELHCLSLNAQSKLLRTLQEMKFRRLGDSAGPEIPFDVTLVAAAKPVILEMIERGEFKDDLYYRIAKSELRIPSLDERREDIKPLANFFAEKYSRIHKRSRTLHPQTIKDMEGYSWPGNARDLERIVERLVMNSENEIIEPELFRAFVKTKVAPESQPEQEKSAANLDVIVDSITSYHIIEALKKSRFIADASAFLGIPRTTLNDRLKKLKINPHQYLGTER